MPPLHPSSDRRRGLKKPVIFMLGVFLGVGCWWGRHYVINAPLWIYRASMADKSDLYAGKTNGVANLDLVLAARNYLTQFQNIEYSGRAMSSSDLLNQGIYLNPRWFNKHHPLSVDTNPFVPHAEDYFVVSWVYAPGCQQATGKLSSKAGSDWFDVRGRPCYGTHIVAVSMTSDLRLTRIRLAPKIYL